ncbi:hypothetical protein AKJ63_01105 [candidate division MSBL1 archaeon SCGC-AAA259D18]|uniref:Uncharacterized protein n=1 Tax=candidate division MSBL1 archaeon SCGC-AAA259D18 TaxID=1698262 RepID=A0A133UBX6_9EURY|nr:hypothetical protein AKJ63_01105 [candidate division MSBL1 archaeon SCGC-AAA259D18]
MIFMVAAEDVSVAKELTSQVEDFALSAEEFSKSDPLLASEYMYWAELKVRKNFDRISRIKDSTKNDILYPILRKKFEFQAQHKFGNLNFFDAEENFRKARIYSIEKKSDENEARELESRGLRQLLHALRNPQDETQTHFLSSKAELEKALIAANKKQKIEIRSLISLSEALMELQRGLGKEESDSLEKFRENIKNATKELPGAHRVVENLSRALVTGSPKKSSKKKSRYFEKATEAVGDLEALLEARLVAYLFKVIGKKYEIDLEEVGKELEDQVEKESKIEGSLDLPKFFTLPKSLSDREVWKIAQEECCKWTQSTFGEERVEDINFVIPFYLPILTAESEGSLYEFRKMGDGTRVVESELEDKFDENEAEINIPRRTIKHPSFRPLSSSLYPSEPENQCVWYIPYWFVEKEDEETGLRTWIVFEDFEKRRKAKKVIEGKQNPYYYEVSESTTEEVPIWFNTIRDLLTELEAGRRTEPEESRCFIATASLDAPCNRKLDILREFRDQELKESFFGEKFVQLYYRVSPLIAKPISKFEKLRNVSRKIFVEPLIESLEEK